MNINKILLLLAIAITGHVFCSEPKISKEQQELNNGLIDAAEHGNFNKVQKYLNDGVDVNTKDDKYGRTALMIAALRGHTKTVKILLKSGAYVNIEDQDGYTALKWASLYGYTEIVKLLLNAKTDVNAKNKYGWTPLMWAAYNGHTQIAKLLLEAGADVNAVNDQGHTALMSTVINRACSDLNTIPIVILLLDHPDIDINLTDKDGKTALQIAQKGHKKEHKQIAELLEYYQNYYIPYFNSDNHEYDYYILNKMANQIRLPVDLTGLINGYAKFKLKFSVFKNKLKSITSCSIQ